MNEITTNALYDDYRRILILRDCPVGQRGPAAGRPSLASRPAVQDKDSGFSDDEECSEDEELSLLSLLS